jgi:hypothetical protein
MYKTGSCKQNQVTSVMCDRIAAIDAHVESKSSNVCVTPTAVNNSNVGGHRPNLNGPVRESGQLQF